MEVAHVVGCRMARMFKTLRQVCFCSALCMHAPLCAHEPDESSLPLSRARDFPTHIPPIWPLIGALSLSLCSANLKAGWKSVLRSPKAVP
eukprot:3068325-Amphidinium_carterae.2